MLIYSASVFIICLVEHVLKLLFKIHLEPGFSTLTKCIYFIKILLGVAGMLQSLHLVDTLKRQFFNFFDIFFNSEKIS